MSQVHAKKRKMAIIAISLFLLLAMVVVVIAGILTSDTEEQRETSHTKRMIEAFCKPTHYKKECESSLTSARVQDKDDPRQLAAEAFNLTRTEIAAVLARLPSLEPPLRNDSRGLHALQICEQLSRVSVRELDTADKSFVRFGKGDFDLFSEDLRVWTGGALSYQDVCLESFKNASRGAGERMRAALLKSRELITNALAIIHEIDEAWKNAPVQEDKEEAGGEKQGQKEEHGTESQGQQTRKEEHGSKQGKEGAAAEEGHTSKQNETGKGHQPKSEAGHAKEDKDAEMEAASRREGSMAGQVPEWVDDQKRSIMGMPLSDIKADVVVAKDGSGRAKTVRQALHMVTKKSHEAFVIHVKQGIYHEHIQINPKLTSIILVGDGPNKTIISGNKNFADGLPIYMTSTVDIDGDGFMARDITFENTAPPEKLHAVAARVTSDWAVFYNVRFSGFYNTLYAIRNRQFFRDCTVSGAVDFVYGDSTAVFQNCLLLVRAPPPGQSSVVTGQGRSDPYGPGASVFQNCTFTAEPSPTPMPPQYKAFLGQPSKPNSRIIVMQSFIDSVIAPEGWAPGSVGFKSVVYREFMNKGPRSGVSGRAKSNGIKSMTTEEALNYSPGKFFAGDDEWITNTGCPYYRNMLQTTK